MQSTRTRTALTAAAALAAVLAALPAAAQRSDAEWLERCRDRDSDRPLHCEVRTEVLQPTGSITADGGESGGARVHGWDGDQVRVSARIQAQAATDAEARELARQVTIRTAGGHIRAEGPARTRGASWSVLFDIQVPRRHDVALTSRSGPVGVEGVTGRITLRAENGPVSLRRVGGAVSARVRNGPLNVELEGERWNGEGLDAEAVNGPATLTIPRDYSARLEVGTVNGPVNMELPLAGGYRSGRHVQTTLGSGGAPVRVVTTNGPFTIRRGSR